jgi:hypothetical protein
MGFSYRQTIGGLIYALTVCRVDIAIAVITLSQHSHHSAQIHYEAVKQVFAYLNATKKDGLTYWRPQPRMDLPIAPDPTPISAPSQLYKFDDQWNALEITGSYDTNHLGIGPYGKEVNGRYCYDVSRSSSLLSNKIATNNSAEFNRS